MASRFMKEFGRVLRETGQAIDRVGLRAIEKPIFKEQFSRHRNIMNLGEKFPWLAPDAYVAPSATVVGEVEINIMSNVGYGAVVRGDLSKVNIGAYTTVGDRTVINTSPQVEGQPMSLVDIGDFVQIGPGCVLQSCTVQRGARIGAGSIIMEGALVEEYAEVAPGSVVHPGRRIPKGTRASGNPASYAGDLSKEELGHREAEAEELCEAAAVHALEFLPHGTAYRHAEKLGVVDATPGKQ